jgi:hypothetical protein
MKWFRTVAFFALLSVSPGCTAADLDKEGPGGAKHFASQMSSYEKTTTKLLTAYVEADESLVGPSKKLRLSMTRAARAAIDARKRALGMEE